MKIRRLALGLILLASAAASTAQIAEVRTRMQPLGTLEGGCWSGRLPTGEIDQHCFSWVYSGAFLRDRHRVMRGRNMTLESESIYYWEPGTGQLRYLWMNSEGGVSQGAVTVENGRFHFPDEVYRDDTGTRTFRTTYVLNGSDSFDSVVEQRAGDQWREVWRVRMVRPARTTRRR